MTSDLTGVLERSILQHINQISQVIIDLRMLLEFMDFYGIGEPQLADYEQRQVRATRLNVRHQQLLAIKNVLTTKVTTTVDQLSTDAPRDVTLLNEILTSDKNLLQKLSKCLSSNLMSTAHNYILSQFVCLNRLEYHPSNLSNCLLRFLDSKKDEVYLAAFSEYLKLMPDNFDLEMELEHQVQV